MKLVYLDTASLIDTASHLFPAAPDLVAWEAAMRFITQYPADRVVATSPNPFGIPLADESIMQSTSLEWVALTTHDVTAFPITWRVYHPDDLFEDFELTWSPADSGLFGKALDDCRRLVVQGVPRNVSARLMRKYGTIEAVVNDIEKIKPKKHWPLIALALTHELHVGNEDIEVWSPQRHSTGQLACLSPLVTEAIKQIEASSTKGYKMVLTMEDLDELDKAVMAARVIAVDTETSGLDYRTLWVVGLSISTEEGKAWYIPLMHYDYLVLPDFLERLRELLADWLLKPTVMHNAKFDLRVLAKMGIEPRKVNLAADTQVMGYCAGYGMLKILGLKKMTKYLLGVTMTEISDLIGKRGKDQIAFWEVPVELAWSYAAADADMTLRIFPIIREKLAEVGCEKLYYELDHHYIYVVMEMEEAGICLDESVIDELGAYLDEEIPLAEQRVYEAAGEEFKLNSPKELGNMLFTKLGLPKTKKTPSGLFSTEEKVMAKLRGKHPIIELIIGDGNPDGSGQLGYRGLRKLKSTYVDNLTVHPVTQRIHCQMNQCSVVSGRLSASDPNLQNIPSRHEIGNVLRTAFIARDGWSLVGVDYSQLELRIMAHIIYELTGDKNDPLYAAFMNGEDPHMAAAIRMFGKAAEDITGSERIRAKTFNFGVGYGLQEMGIAERFHVDRSEAKEMLKNYFIAMPGIAAIMKDSISFCRRNGYTETIFFKRRRYFPNILAEQQKLRAEAERECFNHVVQGSGAEIVKLAQIVILDAMQVLDLQARMLLQVHDEIITEAPPSEIDTVKELINGIASTVVEMHVPLIAEASVGDNWSEVH